MLRTNRRWVCVPLAILCLSSGGLAWGGSPTPSPASSPPARSADETALLALVQRFFAAYPKKDLDGLMSLWSPKSPDFAARKQFMRQVFASTDHIEVKSLAIRKVVVEGDRAKVRVAVETSGVDIEAGKPSPYLGKVSRTFHCVREAEAWKVWQYLSPEDELAIALAAAKTEEERRALVASEKELVTAALVQALIGQGYRDYGQGNYPQALTGYRLAQVIAERIGDRTGLARALGRLGIVHQSQGNHAQALEDYQKSLTQFEALGDRAGIASILGNIGTVHQSQGNYPQALEDYQKSLAQCEALGDKQGAADALDNIGNVHRSQGNYAQALEDHRKSLTQFEALGDKQGAAFALGNIGTVHQSQGNYAQALENYQKSLTQFEALGGKAGIASVLGNIGTVHESQGNYPQALADYQKSLGLAEALGGKAEVASALNNIGDVHRLQGNYAQALEDYQKSLGLKEALGEKAGIASTLKGIGDLHLFQGDYAQALVDYQKSLGLDEALGDKQGIAGTLNSIGNLHRLRGEYVQALEDYRKSLTQLEALGDKQGIASALMNVGNVHTLQGSYSEALEGCRKSLTLFEAMGDKPGIANALNSIGFVHSSQGNYAQSLDDYQKSLGTAEAIGDPDTSFHCYWGIGQVYKAQGHAPDAIAAYRKAINQVEAIRSHVAGGEEEKLTYLHADSKEDIYDSLVSLLVQQGDVAGALSVLERAKSKQLLDGIRLRSLAVRDEKLHALLAKTEDLEEALAAQQQARLAEISKPEAQHNKERLANFTQLVAGTRAELLQVTNAIRAANPDYERFIAVKATDLRSIQRSLPPNVLAVEYLPLETALTIFLVTDQETEARSVAVSRQRIEELVGTVRAEVQLAQRDGGAGARDWDWRSDRARRLRDALTALYGYLIAPIQADLARAGTVIVVPSGALYYLPFQALARVQEDGTLRFLVEEKPLAVLSSLDLWDRIAGKEAAGKGGLGQGRLEALGDPDGTLPAAEREVERIGVLFPQPLVYVGADATRARVESMPPDVRIAHFATHGHLDDRDVNECYLLLAHGDKLTLGDIYGLAGKYPAEMTVLSACQTALGREIPGNEVAHLASGFVEAGSTTIVASLWEVSDASTAALMEKFYQEIKAGKPRSEAMQSAEISLLRKKETAHPFFWAPFILMGDWR